MKSKLAILLAILMTVSVVATPTAKAASISIQVGDQPYYEGSEFWDWGWHWVWVPGHWRHGRWIHGYYVKQGNWSRWHSHHRHHWHPHNH